MGILIQEVEVVNIGELKAFIANMPDDMQVTDAVGELLCLRVYEAAGERIMEVA